MKRPLEHRHATDIPDREWTEMFQKLDEGEGINDVARQHRVPHQTLSDRWRKHNALQSKIPGHVGRPPHLNSGQVTLLVNRIKVPRILFVLYPPF